MTDKKNKNTTIESREKKELVTLSGQAITTSGATSRAQYFDFLNVDLDDYSDIQYSADEAKRISMHLRKLTTGASAMTPMYCAGPQCPVAERCPLQQMNKAPIGRQCIIEKELMKAWIIEYMNEYDVDPSNFTEVGYVNELAELMVLEMRLNIHLSNHTNSSLITDQVVGVDREGTPIIQQQISPFMTQKENIQNRRSKIVKLMVGDRQEKYKKEAALKVKLSDDPSSKYADMRARMEGLERTMNQVAQLSSGSEKKEEKEEILSPEDLFT